MKIAPEMFVKLLSQYKNLDIEDGEHSFTDRNQHSIIFVKNGVLHRSKDLPAITTITMNVNGEELISEEWWYLGKRHRKNKPAVMDYKIQTWFLNDKKHNLNGPAIQRKDGSTDYFIFGEHISEDEFLSLPRNEKQQVHSLSPIKIRELSFNIINGELLDEQQFNHYVLKETTKIANIKKHFKI